MLKISAVIARTALITTVGAVLVSLAACQTKTDTYVSDTEQGPTVKTASTNVNGDELSKLMGAKIDGFFHSSRIIAGGLPTESQMMQFAASGVTTVFDFRSEAEGLEVQKALSASLNLNYINIPLGRELASAAAQEKFAEAFAAAGQDKVLLHCRSGNRVGMIWSLHQISKGVELDTALSQGRAMGMRPGFERAVRASLQ